MPSKSQRARNRALKKSNIVKTTNTSVPPNGAVQPEEDKYVKIDMKYLMDNIKRLNPSCIVFT